MVINVLITGGGSAIAAQTARLWASRGYRIYIVDKDENKARAVANDLKVRGAAEVWSKGLDLSETTHLERLIGQVIKEMGSIDVLLVAQGYLGEQAVAERQWAVAEKIIMTNFTGAAAIMELVAKGMVERGQGTIAVISSVAGDRGRQSIYVYGAAKGALAIWAAGMRHRLTKEGITVITIKPGYVITPMTDGTDRRGWLWAAPEKVARDIVRAVDRKIFVIYTPWFWRWIMLAIKIIPNTVFNKLRI